jgi:hypothetical protein
MRVAPEMSTGLNSKSKLFVHSSIDDAGLSVHAFRVLCHVSRRGNCTEGLKGIARSCRMNKDTAAKALRELERRKAITAEGRSGESTIRRVAPFELWIPAEGNPTEKRGNPKLGVRSHPETGATRVTPTFSDKGTPMKVIPKSNPKGIVDCSAASEDAVRSVRHFIKRGVKPAQMMVLEGNLEVAQEYLT